MPEFAPPLIATYRLQLRDGVGLDQARALLPRLVELGVSHLYLSPLFRAAQASTHGYDVIDPNEVDPVIGGETAFLELADAARAAGVGIVLDIVPNHMGFTPQNPYVADVMRHGRESEYAPVFDIDWDRGKLHFPVLDGALRDVLAAGQIALGKGGALVIYGQDYPLRDTALARTLAEQGELDEAALTALLAEQYWSVGDWRTTANAIIHRRFFNISSLIGVRQEDPAVFALTHRWIVAQVAAGRVQGLRVDHVDGLARPGGYLHRLRQAVGNVPVWIEKIVKQGEEIPLSWPIEGMSGYEFMTPVTQLLTNPDGLAALREAATGVVPADTCEEVRVVRRELLQTTFGPELRRLTDTALAALGRSADGSAEISASLTKLLVDWPVYRSYTADGGLLDPNLAVAGDPLLDLLRGTDDPHARAFAARFEQLTGALTAKSEEDTVFYRAVAYLPFCEVGGEPDLAPITGETFGAQMQARAGRSPLALNTLSTHDTKRTADARAAIVALSHLPNLARRLASGAMERAADAGVAPRWGIYGLQVALMMRHQPDAAARVCEHIAKAMREAKDASSHEAPDEAAERRVGELCLDLLTALTSHALWSAQEEAQFDRVYAQVVLAQAALHLTAPGVPDLYQGTEGVVIGLTDPDNRRAVDWEPPLQRDTLDGRKRALTHELLAQRRQRPDLFTHGDYELANEGDRWIVRRSWEGESAEWAIEKPGAETLPSV
ncbi:maltooligosyl trehalose synthase [Novosphingobium sp. Rr 2-17]|uniref:malto-oligosyltrehalose synthase n=1 Tax=Novosphingobium sp. Rr 2-17 TaxID=555793 RepID=UPI000269A20C|nr:malto-oligosyltrehalose synthase [Novosphingobium sp. Rr 2-17]EIZ78484.1 maltooligosyl trehalose synthase [Novosphingobium sp. Rr 2-17]